MATAGEAAAMRRAIALSAFGLATTSPNPPVGCVILDSDGRIAGEGHHERKGGAHAETQALSAAGSRAAGGTAMVTLEPCNHHGRTPPCRQALIDAGVRRVVISLMDPTSRGEGGATALRAHGISVETGVLENEACLVLRTWSAALGRQRPVVTWPYVLASQGISALTGTAADAVLLRHNADAVLTEDRHVLEGVPGTHGAGILSLKDPAPEDDPHAILHSLYQGGVRSLLLQGGIGLAQPFLASDLVDHLVVHFDPAVVSENLPWPLLPAGFTMTAITKEDRFVRIEARNEQALS